MILNGTSVENLIKWSFVEEGVSNDLDRYDLINSFKYLSRGQVTRVASLNDVQLY
jgi:hypothetical protein